MKKLFIAIGLVVLSTHVYAGSVEYNIKQAEQIIPSLEKQSVVLVKMMNNKKYLDKIQSDIGEVDKRTGRIKQTIKRTRSRRNRGTPEEKKYLQKVFQQLNIPYDNGLAKCNTGNGSKTTIYGLDLNYLMFLSFANRRTNERQQYEITKNILEDGISEENAIKLASVGRKIIEIQTPFQIAARSAGIVPEHTYGMKICHVNSIYSVYTFFPQSGFMNRFNRSVFTQLSRDSDFSKLPITYLNYIKDVITYIESLGINLEGKSELIVKRIDESIEERALLSDLSDLTNDSIPPTPSDELNLNDLKLPE